MATLKDLLVTGPSHLVGDAYIENAYATRIYANIADDRSANKYFATDGTIQDITARTLGYWQGTLAQYLAITTKDPTVLYLITNLNDDEQSRTL